MLCNCPKATPPMTPRGEGQAQGCPQAGPEPSGPTRARRQEQPPEQGLELGAGLTSHQQRPAAPAPPGKTAPHSPNEHPERTLARAPPGGLPHWSSAASQPMKEKENLEVMKRPRGRTNSLPPQLVPTLYRARPGGREVTSAAPRGPQPPVPAAKPPGTAPWPFLLGSACLERNASPGSWQHRLEYRCLCLGVQVALRSHVRVRNAEAASRISRCRPEPLWKGDAPSRGRAGPRARETARQNRGRPECKGQQAATLRASACRGPSKGASRDPSPCEGSRRGKVTKLWGALGGNSA